jgi:type I restriction enzyme S subunit
MGKNMLLSNLDLLATAPGGVAKLRELILTLAVQGKLVPQDPADEPASVLLQKIRAEKDRLIAEGKIKRGKPLAEVTDEEKPFALPQGWVWVRLGDLCSYIQRGKGPVYAENSDHRVVSQKCVRWHGLDLAPARFVTPESLTKYEPIRFLQVGDLLWNSTGTGTIGRACLVSGQWDGAGLVADSHVTVVRPVQISSWFLWRWIQSPYVQSEIEGSASGTTNQIELNTSTVVNHLVPLPPLAEQSRIVTRVEELMRLCDALEAKGQLEAKQHTLLVSTLLSALTTSTSPEALADNWLRVAQHFDLLLDRPEAIDVLEQTILQLAVRGLLVPQDPADEPATELLKSIRAEKDRLIAEGKIKRDKPLPPITDEEKPFELPVGWEWVRLGQIASIASNLVQPSLHVHKWQVAPDCIEKGTGRLLKKRTVMQAEVISPNHLFKPGQILYSKIRPSLSKAVLVDFEGLCSADMYPIESSLDTQYLLMYILSQPFLLQVSIAENRVKMPKLNQEALVAFTFALPPLLEQSRIVTCVTALRRLCADLRQRLADAQTTQSHLAQALVESSQPL